VREFNSKRFKKKPGLKSAAEIGARMGLLSARLNRMMVLQSVWDKEAGRMARHWSLDSVRGGEILVKVSSSAAGQELSFCSSRLAGSLNKYFNRPWIKGIKKI